MPVLSNVNIRYPESDVDPNAGSKTTTTNYYEGGEVGISIYCTYVGIFFIFPLILNARVTQDSVDKIIQIRTFQRVDNARNKLDV